MSSRTGRRGWKILLWTVVGLTVMAVVVDRVISRRLGPRIKREIEFQGPRQLGVPVTVERLRLHALSGRLEMSGFKIENPEGFASRNLLDLGAFSLTIDPLSLRSDTIRVREIRIHAPRLTYESIDGRSNFDLIWQRRQGETQDPVGEDVPAREPAPARPDQPDARPKRAAKRLIVDRFVFEGAEVSLQVKALGSFKPTFILPTVELHGLGQPDGLPPEEIARLIGDEILQAILLQAGLATPHL